MRFLGETNGRILSNPQLRAWAWECHWGCYLFVVCCEFITWWGLGLVDTRLTHRQRWSRNRLRVNVARDFDRPANVFRKSVKIRHGYIVVWWVSYNWLHDRLVNLDNNRSISVFLPAYSLLRHHYTHDLCISFRTIELENLYSLIIWFETCHIESTRYSPRP